MEVYQQIVIILFILINVIVFIKGYKETKHRKNAYKIVPQIFFILGIFVWGDAVVFCAFWVMVSVFSLIINGWILFLLFISVFWLVRSVGETIYWFNQQYSTINKNPPKKLLGFGIYQNDSIWFAYQIFNQCITIITIITTIYLSYLLLAY